MRRRLALTLSLLAVCALAACKGDGNQAAPAAGTATTPTQPGVAPAPTQPGPAATGEDPWAAKGVVAPAIERPLFWSATKDGKTTYLLGTMHLGVNADTQLPAWVKTRLDEGKAFAMETDLSDPRLLGLLQRTDGGSLRLDLGPAHWAKLEEVIGADMARGVDKMKPFAAMTILSAKFLPSTLPMDSVLQTRASSAGKPMVFLEEAVRQLEIVEPFMTAADIKAFLDNVPHAKAQSEAMLAAYQRGDEAVLRTMFEDKTLWVAAGRDPAQFSGFIEALLATRNRSWIPAIEQLHAEGGGFVAVGAGHLVGPSNVLDLLAARGFTITRVTAGPGTP